MVYFLFLQTRGTLQPTAQQLYALSQRRVVVNLAPCATCGPLLTGRTAAFRRPVVRSGPPGKDAVTRKDKIACVYLYSTSPWAQAKSALSPGVLLHVPCNAGKNIYRQIEID